MIRLYTFAAVDEQNKDLLSLASCFGLFSLFGIVVQRVIGGNATDHGEPNGIQRDEIKVVVEQIGNSVKPGVSARGVVILRRKPKYRELEGQHDKVQEILDQGANSKLF